MDANIVTVGLVGIVAVCVGGGIGVVIWLYNQFGTIRSDLLAAIAKSREGGDAKSNELGEKIDELSERQRRHEMLVEQRFITKDSASVTYVRFEKTLDEVKADVRDLLRQVGQAFGNRRGAH